MADDRDDIEEAICRRILERRAAGLRKYGVSLTDRKDLTLDQYLVHMQEELMDAILYIEKFRRGE